MLSQVRLLHSLPMLLGKEAEYVRFSVTEAYHLRHVFFFAGSNFRRGYSLENSPNMKIKYQTKVKMARKIYQNFKHHSPKQLDFLIAFKFQLL